VAGTPLPRFLGPSLLNSKLGFGLASFSVPAPPHPAKLMIKPKEKIKDKHCLSTQKVSFTL
jgi:hypothetical protein